MRASTALVGKKSYHGYESLSSGDTSTKPIGLIKRKVEDGSDSDHSDGEKNSATFLTIDVLPADTIQSLSLQYRCPVADIKRANALIKEQDLFARQTIKIPVKKHSLLTEKGPRRRTLSREDNQFSTTSFTADDAARNGSFSNGADAASAPLLPITDSTSESSAANLQATAEDFRLQAAEKNDVTGYLKSLDKDIRKTVKKADLKGENTNDTLTELTSSLTDYSSGIPSIQRRPLHQRDTMNGADCGFTWWSVFLCFILVLLLIIFLALMEYYYNSK